MGERIYFASAQSNQPTIHYFGWPMSQPFSGVKIQEEKKVISFFFRWKKFIETEQIWTFCRGLGPPSKKRWSVHSTKLDLLVRLKGMWSSSSLPSPSGLPPSGSRCHGTSMNRKRIVTWSHDCLQRIIIISHLKPCNCSEYLKPYDCEQIIDIR